MADIYIPWDREAILLSMGYRDYDNYLSRALWKKIKQRVLERDDWTCRRCNGKAELVHHRSYSREVLEGLDDSMLAAVCDGCHHVVEFRDDGARRATVEKDEVLLTRAFDVQYPPVKVDLRRATKLMPSEWERLDWFQRTGWNAEYMYVYYTKRMTKGATAGAAAERVREHHRSLFEAVRSRTRESSWRDMPLWEFRAEGIPSVLAARKLIK
ncbi:hypothetical protein [Burkholderia ambifaria]|uniref:hypothetical protein n=1 Tax=Burkholderia ambifaria TaxID=152480 RepID=UPI000F80829E|nr:hypothetical protein [Burkholderia ambifaria]